ncbi:gastrin/cholecystokinin type B receptor-like [Babylonia areolata]|uniref:gastrin/cholecystokinin type B receptor-like n=1 Tax=Babylonia areolata TaxID=304850 RepID=UPI003FD3C398
MSLTGAEHSPPGDHDHNHHLQNHLSRLAHDVTSSPALASTNNQSEDKEQLLQSINDLKAMHLLPAILVTLVLMLVGLLSNPLAIYIYGWRWQSSSTKIFLFALAVIDLLNCLITIPTEVLSMRNYYDFPSDALCKVSRFITYVMNNATVVIFLAIAVDRYTRICHPYRTAVSARGAKAACGVGLALGVTVSWPALLLYGRIELQIPARLNPPVFVTGAMCFVHKDMEKYSLAFFVYLCSAFFVCVLILVVLYTLIGRVILRRKRMLRQRKEATAAALETLGGVVVVMTKNGTGSGAGNTAAAAAAVAAREGNALEVPSASSTPYPSPSPARRSGTTMTTVVAGGEEGEEGGETGGGCNVQNFSFRCKKLRRPPRATLMLFLITVVFISSFLPFLIISIIRQHRGPAFYLGLSSREQVVVNIFIRSYIVNNCTNPIVYGLCNSQFRDECRRLYLALCRRGRRFVPSAAASSAAAANDNLQRGGGGGGGGGDSRTGFVTPRLERKPTPKH